LDRKLAHTTLSVGQLVLASVSVANWPWPSAAADVAGLDHANNPAAAAQAMTAVNVDLIHASQYFPAAGDLISRKLQGAKLPRLDAAR
jgi:hypothetical protein